MPGQYLLAAPWDWGRAVLTGAIAEHEELEAIKPRMASIEEQMNEVIAFLEESNERIEEKINQAVSQAYWRGFKHGGGLGALIGIGLGIWIAD
jgi:tetrahydromethanopterin S-methyltransferase subunit G